MPKSARRKYYAVRTGRQGPKIYDTWSQCEANVSRWPSAKFKAFTSRQEAEQWVAMPIASVSVPGVPDVTNSVDSCTESSASNQCQIPPVPPLSSDIVFSPEQKRVLHMVQGGQNVFFTGSAGTGKSVLLREIIRVRGGRGSSRVAITASTGIAAINIGGTTIHSWAGIGLGQEDAKKLAGKFLGQPKFENVRDRWRKVQTLIIDEISMIDGALFDKLVRLPIVEENEHDFHRHQEYIARILRRDKGPFGGIQLVVSGDFCQLPPVPNRDANGVSIPALFAFEASSWKRCITRPVLLTKVFRQRNQAFVDILNLLRWGVLDVGAIRSFKSLSRPVPYTDGIGPTELYPTRAEVYQANWSRLVALSGAGIQYDAIDTPGVDSNGERVNVLQMERLLDRLVAPQSALLKVGAQVMLIKNLIQGQLVNGSVGQVIRFSTPQEAKRNDTDIGTEEGVRGNKPEALQEVEKYSNAKWPVVQFTNKRELLCVPADFTVNNANGEVEAQRRQVPLILAWALSVHKSQGQTLERVRVDLSRTFEKGQAYVALSRATSMDTLEVYNFDPSRVMVHPRVVEWYENTEREDVMSENYDGIEV